MTAWRSPGLLAITVNQQGGRPQGYSKDQPWHNSAFIASGELRPEYLSRLQRVLDAADQLGMVVIVGYFYFVQDERLHDEAAAVAPPHPPPPPPPTHTPPTAPPSITTTC